jgi:preprotein translocase SecA subunit
MVLARVLRAGEGKIVRQMRKIAKDIEGLEEDVVDLTQAELQKRTENFKERYADGEPLDAMLPEAFAVVREAAKRVLNQRHFEVQLMGGAALHYGYVAEMKTGEGKTLTCVLPAYLNALAGRGVHVVTVNDYLVKRDATWMGKIHEYLGLSVGMILSNMSPEQRRVAYEADITYGTNNEFGFDYLRDNMAWGLEDCVQREHYYAIVDEVDSILIDEARTPLIISGPAGEQSLRWYQEFARMAPMMRPDIHYEVDLRKRTVGVIEAGVAFIEDQLGIDNLYEAVNTPLVGYLNNALKAKELYRKDKDYIVRGDEVLIVDEFTGRVLHGRRYNEGMHQAIEAKEKVTVKAENQTLATITLQNYFRLYEKLSGMTGTAQTEAAELHQTYKLHVVPIPTNKPMIRTDQSDLIYKTEQGKYEAIAEDIAERHVKGQPVLVGTTSVERSDYLSKLLIKLRVPHEVLNARPDQAEREAEIIAQAGQRGAVTIATNMAGRGTDIVLGGAEIERKVLKSDEEDEEAEESSDLAGDPAEIQAHRKATDKGEEKARNAAEAQTGPIADEAKEEALDQLGSTLIMVLKTTDEVTEQRTRVGRLGGADKVEESYFERRDVQFDQLTARIHDTVFTVLTKNHDVSAEVAENVAAAAAQRALDVVKKDTERSSKKDRGQEEAKRVARLSGLIGTEIYDTVHDVLYPELFSRLVPDLFESAVYDRVYAEAYEEASADRKAITALGGLYVLGTERHESRRIDNQLRGRSGRQGDPGESRFYLSLGDELMRRFNATMVERIMTTLRVPEDTPIEAKMVTRAIKSAQTQVEQQNFEIRKNVLKYDDVMNEQRKVIYGERRRMLEGEDISDQIEHMITDVARAYVEGATAEGYAEDWDHEKLWTALRTLYPVSLNWEDLAEGDEDLTREYLQEAVTEDILRAYHERETMIDGQVGEGAMRELERKVVLSVLDRKWREHLYEMDYLKEGIGLRAMAQRDPLIEYQREGYEMFSAMLDAMKEETVGFLFNLQVETAEPEPAPTTATEVPAAFARATQAARNQTNGTVTSNGNGNGRGRHAAPDPEPEPEPPTNVPPALRGKGLGGPEQQRLNYSGPTEDGSVESHEDSSEDDGPGSGTRRERRAAARANAKKGRKGPRR